MTPLERKSGQQNKQDETVFIPQLISDATVCSPLYPASSISKASLPSCYTTCNMAGLSLQFEWDPGCSCCLLSASTWERIVAADSTLQLQQAPLVIAANN